MKFIISICFILSVVAFGSLDAVRVCVIRAANCNSNVNACGRYGRSNLCQRFQNNCYLESANCSDNIGYTAVNASLCNGIALNQRRLCNGLSSTTTGTGGLWSNLFGGSKYGSNVQPIIINTGK
ncbi:uncharacterized protein LOC101896622 [Musca domestica]|uniref:Uncharacterized protein LOC101896622 n=1 Tax=Musca domestica TaxID=7370 RepID=A0A1I8MST3_MUSDO|nr:uncharacterized protein LOC101896622 [Musca domestica]